MKKGEQLKKGFTIIEVSLVLAIAGLIFLMVFIALPSLRMQQRDTSRREDIISFLDNIKKYQTNNRGALPGSADPAAVLVSWSNELKESQGANTTWRGFYRDYLGEFFNDPDGEHYKLQVLACGESRVDRDCQADAIQGLEDVNFPNDYKLYIVTQATCNGSRAVAAANPRKLAVLYRLEGAGVYCNSI